MPESAAATAKVILFFDQLFDSFNGKEGQGLSSIINLTSGHKQFWQTALSTLRDMEFVDQTTLKPIRRNAPKCLKNWMWTIRGAVYLWKTLKKCGFTRLNLKHLNQDVVENFFGQVRANGYRNVNPSPYQFGKVFRTLLTTNLTSRHSLSANCKENEKDSMDLLTLLNEAEIIESDNNDNDVDCVEAAIPTAEVTNMLVDVHMLLTNYQKKLTQKCVECTTQLLNETTVNAFIQAVDIVEMQFPNFCQELKIKEKVTTILKTKTISVQMHCHATYNDIIEIIAEKFLIGWCKFLNKILNRKITDGYETNYVYHQANLIAARHTKKSKYIF